MNGCYAGSVAVDVVATALLASVEKRGKMQIKEGTAKSVLVLVKSMLFFLPTLLFKLRVQKPTDTCVEYSIF